MSSKLKIPKFKNKAAEQAFWSKVDLSKYFEAADFENVSFPNLKPSSQAISIRIPQYLMVRVKAQANELDVPYQSLIKQYIAQGIKQGVH